MKTKSCFAEKTLRVSIGREKNETARREGGLFVWTWVCISAYLRLLLHHPDEKLPTFPKEVGFGRRLRGDPKSGSILGGILLDIQNVSMIFTLRKFKHQHRPAAGYAVGNQAPQTLRSGARVEQAIPHEGEELLKLRFGELDGSR